MRIEYGFSQNTLLWFDFPCRKAAMKGKQVCRAHGGCSTGPLTRQGRKRCAEARYQHGWETRKIRELRAQKFLEMKTLFSLIED